VLENTKGYLPKALVLKEPLIYIGSKKSLQ